MMYKGKHMFYIVFLLIVLTSFAFTVHADVIIDNGNPGTSYTGSWGVSGGANPYGTDSVWSRNGDTYSWQMSSQPAGVYEVYMWWSGYSSRATSISVAIDYANGTQTTTINQQQNAGQWNSLGQYYFNTTGKVTITAATSSTASTCADAVRFVYVSGGGGNTPPVANNDTATTTANTQVTVNVLANDTDAEGNIDPATVTITSSPAHGTSVPQSNGTIRYTPSGGYTGPDTFKYTVKDTGGAVSNAATVNVTVNSASSTPVATINSIFPDLALPGEEVTFYGSGTDSDGTITGFSWRSSRDGQLSSSASFSDTSLSVGTHTIFFKVQDNSGKWSPEVSASLEINRTEDIYAFGGYGPEYTMSQFRTWLRNFGATGSGSMYTYVNTSLNRTYIIHVIENDVEAMKQALRTKGAHILYFGHSNYGLGPVFGTTAEINAKVINNLYYIDDDRIFNMSSPWIHVSISGMRTGQAYPYWWPIFKDGTSGIMPYDFGDPQGNPPYNYYLTYQLPGDPTLYKVEPVHDSAVERFFGCGAPAWDFSQNAAPPDPNIPEQRQYFITNPNLWTPSFVSEGNWVDTQTTPGYFKENYQYSVAGSGNDWAQWFFSIPHPGSYNVYAWWTSTSDRPTNAPYTVYHAAGSTTVRVNQKTNGKKWNLLGKYNFDIGDYSVVLTDNADSGNVVADGIRVADENNPTEIIQSDFTANLRSGVAPLSVDFSSQETGDVTGWSWAFGDGSTNNTRDSITHIYTNPGTYTVSLTVTGPLGSNTRTKTGYITVGSTTPPLQAEFSASSKTGTVPRSVRFRDRSSGSIVSWLWDFGDGITSTEQSPTHIYSLPGNYTVKLTVTDANNSSKTETKANFVRTYVFEKSIDNVDYPKAHCGSKVIIYRKELEVPKEEFKYKRMFYLSCNSGNYFIDTFNRGTMFYTLNASAMTAVEGFSLYLQAYLQGKSDEEIWQGLQAFEPVFDFYNFNKLPSEQ
jgi:PKD repeat protein